MPLDPSKTVFERVQFIQRDTVAGLPPLNQGGSPKLGTLARLNNGQFWCVVVDDTSPTLSLIWQQVGGGSGGAVPPDVRFVVGKLPLDLNNPSVATYTSIAQALAAVQTYQLSTGGLPATILLHPDTYAESVVLPPNVSIEGLGSSNTSVIVTGSVQVTGAANSRGGVGNLRCATLQVDYAFNSERVDIRNVEVDGLTTINKVGNGFSLFVSLESSFSGGFSSSGTAMFFAIFGGRITDGQFVDPIGGAVQIRAFNTYLSVNQRAAIVALRGCRGDFLNCVWDNGDDTRPLLSLQSNALAAVTTGARLRRSAPYVVVTPDNSGAVYWSNVAGVSGDPADLATAFAPNLAVREALVTANGNAGITLPVVVDGVAVPEAAMPSAAETVEVTPSYAVAIDSTRANNAYALLRIALSSELINRKRVTIVNSSNPSQPTSGPVALVMSAADTINQLTGMQPTITSLDYVILAPGDYVTLSRVVGGWVIAL